MEREFEMVVPATDNSGARIRTDILEVIAQRMARHFGGVTVLPVAAGCYVDQGRLECDQNIVLKSDRYKGPDGGPATAEMLADDQRFMDALGHEVAKSLGQQAVFEQEASDIHSQELAGKYQVSLPARKIESGAPRRNPAQVFGDLIP